MARTVRSGRGKKGAADANPSGASASRSAATPPAAQATDAAPRARKSAERREAILNAALDEFSSRGFAAARLDDVAARAGVAKGTIYLHFADKEALFQEIVRAMIVPVVSAVEVAPPPGMPVRTVLNVLIDRFVQDVYGTRRRDVIRLMMTEGPRFPALAEFYYRNVVERALKGMRVLLTAAIERGELRDDALLRFPQLIVAPAMMAVVWSGLFERFAPLDVAALMKSHLDLYFGREPAP
jgi:AcrR family transcriptional regulator